MSRALLQIILKNNKNRRYTACQGQLEVLNDFFRLGLLLKSETNRESNTIDDVINELIVSALKIGKKSAVGVEISPTEQFQVKKLHHQST